MWTLNYPCNYPGDFQVLFDQGMKLSLLTCMNYYYFLCCLIYMISNHLKAASVWRSLSPGVLNYAWFLMNAGYEYGNTLHSCFLSVHSVACHLMAVVIGSESWWWPTVTETWDHCRSDGHNSGPDWGVVPKPNDNSSLEEIWVGWVWL